MLFTATYMDGDEIRVIQDIDSIRKSLGYALGASPQKWYGYLRRSMLAKAIRGSNSIEGYNITRDDAMAVAEGDEPFDAKTQEWLANVGYRNAMTYVLQLANDPHFSYSDGLIRSLHYMMLQYDMPKNPGRWRPGNIFVRDEQKNETVYEGPEFERVPKLMSELMDSLNMSTKEHPIIRGAMAHLNLAMIHPFSDGNGRMARCLQTLVLARDGILAPQFCSIEEYLGRNTQPYYDVLATVGQGSWNPQNDSRPWIRFCLTAHFRQAMILRRRIKEANRVGEQLDIEIKKHGFPDRVLAVLFDAAFGYRVRNSSYRITAEISENLASRDFKELVEAGLLVATGERRGRFYMASKALAMLRERAKEPREDEHLDPFTSGDAASQGNLPFS